MCVPVCVHVCIYVFYINLQANSQIYIKMQRAKNSQDILGKELKEREKKKKPRRRREERWRYLALSNIKI